MLNNLLPEGFKDEVSSQAATEHKYTNIIIDIFQSYGYELVKAPLIEFSENINSRNSLKIQVKKDQKKLTIRDDITMQIARLSSARLSKKKRPLKLCYYGEVVCNEGTMIRPERQFLQIGAECIGEESFLADVEMIELAYKSLNAVGIRNISIELSSRIFLDQLYNFIKDKNIIEKLHSLIRKKDISNSLKLVESDHQEYLKNIFSCIGNFSEKIKNLEKLKINKKNEFEIENLINIYEKINDIHPEINFFIDLTEFDNKSYHNSTRFTIFAENVRGEIARGGRYFSSNNNLTEKSTGFTCYMDTILRASSNIEITNKILIPYDVPENKKKELIKKGFVIETFFGKNENLKNSAIERKFHSYLLENKIIQLNK